MPLKTGAALLRVCSQGGIREASRRACLTRKRFAWPPIALILLAGCAGQLRAVRHEELRAPSAAVRIGSAEHLDGAAGVVPPKSQWRVYASLNDARAAADDDPATSALTPPEQGNHQWILVDLGQPCRLRAVRQVHAAGQGAPRRYRIDTAGAKGYPWTLQWIGSGSDGESLGVFRHAVEARFLRITVLAEPALRWGVTELEVF